MFKVRRFVAGHELLANQYMSQFSDTVRAALIGKDLPQ
jgi:hypothetical protein